MYFETPESPRIFKSDFLDFFTRVHWATVPALFVPISLAGIAISVEYAGVSLPMTLLWFAIGFVCWTLAEYWLHRELFHWTPPGKIGETFHFFVHGVHHQWPADKFRLVMPPWVNLSLLFLIVGPITLFLAPHWGWGWLAGFVMGYMHYDTTHYWIHHAKFQSTYFKRLKAHHMNHHHNPKPRKYGVSFTFWDHVFGTNE